MVDEQHDRERDGSRRHDNRDGLRSSVFQHEEVVGYEIGQEAARRVLGADVERHQIHAMSESRLPDG
jgi:hypothetical protein